MYITDNMTGAATNKALVINADADSHGSTGTLTVATAGSIDSNDSDVTITAWDLDLDGTKIDAGTKSLTGYSTPRTLEVTLAYEHEAS